MGRKKMVILDSEEAYVKLFASFAAQKRLLPFEPTAFTNVEKLESYALKNPIGLLLVSEHMLEDRLFHIHADKVAVLEENCGKAVPDGVFCVDKYQPCTKILETLLWEYERKGMYTGVVKKREFQIAAVCSPIGRTGKTAFALALSR